MAQQLSIAIAEKRFGEGPALFSDFNLEVAAGSVVALLGPSGVGKSSLVRMVAGIDRAFEGTVLIDGVPAAEAPRPGLVFQDPRLLPWLSAIDNIRASDARMDRATALAALERVGLAGHGEAFPHQLSGGMQRRVALARALAVNAELLLLDEPFVSLDRALADEMQELVAALIAATGPTVLLVTHLAEDAARLADRVIVLAGRPAQIVADVSLPVARAARDRVVIDGYVQFLAMEQSGLDSGDKLR
jgi:NitT/TauT family transport system ATP-binding protein/sulfonate transport system ATP-binding protein